MNQTKSMFNVLNAVIVSLVLIVTICGICSYNTAHAYTFVNQYNDTIRMWGTGVYAHDSYFKAPIFVGSDFTILVYIVPLAIVTFVKTRKAQSTECYVRSFAVLGLLLYYSASLAFGVTYNILHLAYIALFSACFFNVGLLLAKLHTVGVKQEKVCSYNFTKGMKAFLLISGIALVVAWLPDIIASIAGGTSLAMIEVYTTEITYVLDMGIISPLMFLTYYLNKRNNFIGYVLLRMIFKVCVCIGIMLPIQSAFQLMAGISIPIPALVTKVIIFVILAVFAGIFEHRLKHETQYVLL